MYQKATEAISLIGQKYQETVENSRQNSTEENQSEQNATNSNLHFNNKSFSCITTFFSHIKKVSNLYRVAVICPEKKKV